MWGLEVGGGSAAVPRSPGLGEVRVGASLQQGAARFPRQSAPHPEQSGTPVAPTACTGAAEGQAPLPSSSPAGLAGPPVQAQGSRSAFPPRRAGPIPPPAMRALLLLFPARL